MDHHNYSVLLASNRPHLLYGALISLANQTIKPREIIIKDNGDSSILGTYEIRFMTDMLRYEGITVECFRNLERRTLTPSRNDLVKRATHETLVFMDDDCFWQHDVAQFLLWGLQTYTATVGLQLTASYETGLGATYTPPLPSDIHDQFSLQTHPCVKPLDMARGCTIMFRKKDWSEAIQQDMETWEQELGHDDLALLLRLGQVGIVQQARIWHLLSPDERKIPLAGTSPLARKFQHELKDTLHVRNQ